MGPVSRFDQLVESRRSLRDNIANTVTNTNNLSLRSILEKDKLSRSNFLDWERNLMIVLKHERKATREAPPANATTIVRNAYRKHSDDLLNVGCLMLLTMSLELQTGLMNTNAYGMIRQLRDMFQTQACTKRYDATRIRILISEEYSDTEVNQRSLYPDASSGCHTNLSSLLSLSSVFRSRTCWSCHQLILRLR
ncbi:hypothetical protein OSB04_012575 [Centaurea solstitialis]|uniref:Uncharacterized protein n=1 Tax=Centaurea solstitialis TaxID=347529 RepID=A0AA38WQQ9_9ASTR|nr:hypothetical protein OSB04_012575 [Centaurea solstitialis]